MYTPAIDKFIPVTLRKIYRIDSSHPTFSLTTNYANDYPITIKNVILTSKILEESFEIKEENNPNTYKKRG
jgi:hypothetical protein